MPFRVVAVEFLLVSPAALTFSSSETNIESQIIVAFVKGHQQSRHGVFAKDLQVIVNWAGGVLSFQIYGRTWAANALFYVHPATCTCC
jgi:hypothetical protein